MYICEYFISKRNRCLPLATDERLYGAVSQIEFNVQLDHGVGLDSRCASVCNIRLPRVKDAATPFPRQRRDRELQP